jgi:hypothetical protein
MLKYVDVSTWRSRLVVELGRTFAGEVRLTFLALQ